MFVAHDRVTLATWPVTEVVSQGNFLFLKFPNHGVNDGCLVNSRDVKSVLLLQRNDFFYRLASLGSMQSHNKQACISDSGFVFVTFFSHSFILWSV